MKYGVRRHSHPPCRNPIFISPSFHLQWYPMRALQDGTAAYLGWGTANQPVCPIFSCFRYVPCVRPPTGRKLTGRRDGPFRASAGRCQPATFHLPLKAQVSSILPCLYRKVQVTDHPLSQWPPSLPFVCIYTLCYCYVTMPSPANRHWRNTPPCPTSALPAPQNTTYQTPVPDRPTRPDLFWSGHDIFEKPYP